VVRGSMTYIRRRKTPAGDRMNEKKAAQVVRDASRRLLRGAIILGDSPAYLPEDQYIRIVHSSEDRDQVGFRLCSLVDSGCTQLGTRAFYPMKKVRKELRLAGVEKTMDPALKTLVDGGLIVGGIGVAIGGVAVAAIPALGAGAVVSSILGGMFGGGTAALVGVMNGSMDIFNLNSTSRMEVRAIRKLTKKDSLWINADAPIETVRSGLETQLQILDSLLGE